MTRIAIIVGHARKDTFCEALGEAYRRGAEGDGHKATLFVTSKMMFNPILHEGFTKIQPLEQDLRMAHDVKRNIPGFLGVSPIRSTIHGMIEAVTPEMRNSWLDAAEAMGRKGA